MDKAAIAIGALLLALSASELRAQLIGFDDFETYGSGVQLHNLNGGSGFTGAWNVTSPRRPEVTVLGSGLNYSNGSLTFNGGNRSLQYAATEGGISAMISRAIPSQSGTVYYSFLYNNTVDSGDNDFLQLGLDNSSLPNPRVSALDRSGNFQSRLTTSAGNSNDSGIATTTAETFFVVVKAEKTGGSGNYNEISLWVNPTSQVEGDNTPAVTGGPLNSGLGNASFFAVRKAFQEAGDTAVVDEVRIGDSFFDVTGLPPTADANGPYVFDEGTLSVTLDGSGSSDADGTVAQYNWTIPDASDISTGSATTALSIADSGLENTLDVDTVSLSVTDDDSRTSTADTSTISFANSPPVAQGVTQQRLDDNSIEFTLNLLDLDLSINNDISDFELLVWELDTVMASDASEVGDGFATGTISPTSDAAIVMEIVSNAELFAAFGDQGTFPAFLSVIDLEGRDGGQGGLDSFSSFALQIEVVPEPGGVAIWLLMGLALVAIGRRLRRERT